MKLKVWGGTALGVVLLIAGVVVYGLNVLERQEAEHARFFETGKVINQLLTDYAGAINKIDDQKDISGVSTFYSANYDAPGRGQWVLKKDIDISDISSDKLISEGGTDYNLSALNRELQQYVDSLSSIKRVKCKIDMIEEIDPEKAVTLRVKYILDGVDQEGLAFQDRFFYRWWLSNEGSSDGAFDWKIVRDQLVEGVRVSGMREGFASIDPMELGIDYTHARDPELDANDPNVDLSFQMIQYAFGGVSAVDYNNDDRMDLFFADGLESKLYRNDGLAENEQVKFTDVTEDTGLNGIDHANLGLFADFNNDGHKDVFVVRFFKPGQFFQNNGDGTYIDKSAEMGLDFVAPAMSATLLDYDRDGFLDIYVGVYGDTFENIPRLFFFARNGEPNRLFHNDGGKGFTDVSEQSGAGDIGWTLAVAAGDYNNDGYTDLMNSNDFGRKNLYRNNKDGTFTDVAKEAGVLDLSGGMGVTFGDYNDDGLMDIYTSNINSNQRWFGENVTILQYLRNVIRTKWVFEDLQEYLAVYDLFGDNWVELAKMSGEGNSLFENNGDGTFTELKDSHTNRAGWGWSVAFFDMDNDTDQDIYAANGWISQDPTSDL
jgi:hypothetical protein